MDDENQYNNEAEGGEESENEGEDVVSYTTQANYDPNFSEKIICIELENNEQLFLEYKEGWVVQDLILEVLNRNEFKKLYQNRNLILNSKSHPHSFDFSLCFYDSIMQPHENRVADYITLDKLHDLHILKNYRTPFFILKEGFMPSNYIYSGNYKIEQLKEVKDSKFNQYAMYLNYLPKLSKITPNLLLAHPELEDYFIRNKKGYNEFMPFKRNILTCDKPSVDWFIYDKESMKFLIEMEKKEYEENSVCKYINGKIYFEDKHCVNPKYTIKNLKDNELDKFFVKLNIDLNANSSPPKIESKTFRINSKTTSIELIEKFCSMYKGSKFRVDAKKKILKVKSLNDYIFEVNEPLINYEYINECVKLNQTAEYVIIDNPGPVDSQNERPSINSGFDGNKSLADLNMSTVGGGLRKANQGGKYDLRSIASYNPTINDINSDVLNPKQVLEKEINSSNISNIDNSNKTNSSYMSRRQKNYGNNALKNYFSEGGPLETLINSFNQDVQKEIEIRLKEDDIKNQTKNESLENLSKNEEDTNLKKANDKSKMFLRLNDENSKYLKKRKKYKNFKRNQLTPNIFEESLKNKNDKQENQNEKKYNTKGYNKRYNSRYDEPKNIFVVQRKPLINKTELNSSEISRPFSILFRSAEIVPLLNSYSSETKNITTVLLFRFELFSSNVSIRPPKQIRWKTINKVQNPLFNKRIYFDIKYNQLPKVCSLMFQVKFIQYDKNNEVYKNDTVFWSNFRLFDQNNRLRVGMHKINLHDREISDDIYYLFSDNPKEEGSSKIYFEIENFGCPVINKIQNKSKINEETDSELVSVDGDLIQKINRIDQKSPFDDLTVTEKQILWKNRFYIAGINSLIPRLFLSCDYNNPNINQEIEKVIKKVSELSVVKAIELLSGKFVNEIVRNFAVNNLKKVSPANIQAYLLQLVQALKYEKNHDNPLARFLLECAIENPVTIGHEFFWHLRSEMHNQDVQQRFGLYLEVFLSKISRHLFRIFRDEDNLLKNLINIAEKIKEKKDIEERDRVFKEDLNVIDGYLSNSKKEVSLPLNFKYRINGLVTDKCKIMKSKKKPLWLTFKNADPLGENIVVMLKCGDDLRMDMVTLQLFKAMQTLWFESGLKVKMSLYKVLCTGNQQGMLEMVTNSETLANIHVKEGGAIKQLLSKGGVKNWIEKNCNMVSPQEAIENFMLSNIAYCLATFVLGIGDRHNDNIMLKKNGELFHIDFGHFLGHFKYKMGIKRERAPFVFTRQFQSVLGDDDSDMFKEFKSKLEKGYIILRNNKEVLLALLSILLCTGIPELNEKSLRYIESSLLLKKDDKEAIEFLNKKLQESMDSVSTKLNFAIHIVANK